MLKELNACREFCAKICSDCSGYENIQKLCLMTEHLNEENTKLNEECLRVIRLAEELRAAIYKYTKLLEEAADAAYTYRRKGENDED